MMSRMASTSDNSPMTPEPTRLRQIALVAHDLDRARRLLTTVIGTEVIYEDPLVAQWGLKNILVPLGGDIIEVVSPISPSPSVPASRHLSKHGEGGYMIIMQTSSATRRREYLQSNKLAKVIFEHNLEDSICIQYHPKGIKGGVIPELDSHFSRGNGNMPDGMKDRIAPWHACGPGNGFENYKEAMRRHSHLHLLAVSLQLAPMDCNVEGAAKQWEGLFGIKRAGRGEVGFTNARMSFLEGKGGEKEGLKEIVVGVEGEKKLSGILRRARNEGLEITEERDVAGTFEMLGVRWRFVLLDESQIKSQL